MSGYPIHILLVEDDEQIASYFLKSGYKEVLGFVNLLEEYVRRIEFPSESSDSKDAQEKRHGSAFDCA